MALDPQTVEAVWRKGRAVSNNDPKLWRQDECGAWMGRSHYGNRNSQYGWEIDHITSQDHGGPDSASNLRPLQWQNNASKGAGRLKCSVTANGVNNGPA